MEFVFSLGALIEVLNLESDCYCNISMHVTVGLFLDIKGMEKGY